MSNCLSEKESLEFVRTLQSLLAEALDSLAGKETEGEVSYLIWGSAHINKVVGGYCELRGRSMIHASKMMIRPVIETTFSVVAALEKKGFLFQKAYTEYVEEQKLLNEWRDNLKTMKQPTAELQKKLQELERDFDGFKQCVATLRPNDPIKCATVNVRNAAQAANLVPLYAQYRVYCQFTHGALRAASGDMDAMTDPADNHVVGWLILIILDHLKKHAPVNVPDLKQLWLKAESLMRQSGT